VNSKRDDLGKLISTGEEDGTEHLMKQLDGGERWSETSAGGARSSDERVEEAAM
jgi:hypothetical protein